MTKKLPISLIKGNCLKKINNYGYDEQNDRVHENKRDEIKILLMIAILSSSKTVDIHRFLAILYVGV